MTPEQVEDYFDSTTGYRIVDYANIAALVNAEVEKERERCLGIIGRCVDVAVKAGATEAAGRLIYVGLVIRGEL